MVRISLLCVALCTLAQLVPSCPSTSTPTPTERGRIETTATSDAGAGVDVGKTVNLTASADGDNVSYSWVQTAGPGVQLDDGASAASRFVAPSLKERKTLRFQVSTRNAGGDVGSADVKVVVNADPNFGANPQYNIGTTGSTLIARAGPDKDAEEAKTVELSALNSAGPIVSYRWRLVTGAGVTLSAPTAAVTTFTAPEFVTGGTNKLEFELTIKDASDTIARDRVVITITKASDSNGNTNGNGPLPRVKVKTTLGDFVIQLEQKKSPKTVENFLAYVDDNFYDNLLIHRVVAGFVIQGGGFSPGLVEKDVTRDPVQSEASNGLRNVRGTVAMALRGGDPNSGTTQFFVNLVDNLFLDEQQFTVFGSVVEGMNIIDTIGTVQTVTRNSLDNVPVNDIVITDIQRLP